MSPLHPPTNVGCKVEFSALHSLTFRRVTFGGILLNYFAVMLILCHTKMEYCGRVIATPDYVDFIHNKLFPLIINYISIFTL